MGTHKGRGTAIQNGKIGGGEYGSSDLFSVITFSACMAHKKTNKLRLVQNIILGKKIQVLDIRQLDMSSLKL